MNLLREMSTLIVIKCSQLWSVIEISFFSLKCNILWHFLACVKVAILKHAKLFFILGFDRHENIETKSNQEKTVSSRRRTAAEGKSITVVSLNKRID